MPRVDGLEALAELRAAAPDVGIVVLSGFERHRMAAKALALGADRYLEKAAGMEDVRATVRAVAAGRRGPRRAARGGAVRLPPRPRRPPRASSTARERHALEIHDNLVQGLTAIHWALEAGAYDQAREPTRATLAQAQGMIGDLLGDHPDGRAFAPGALRRDAPAAHRP